MIEDWFFLAAILDPQAGRIQILHVGYRADMQAPAWTSDGKIVVVAHPLQVGIWCYRPERSN